MKQNFKKYALRAGVILALPLFIVACFFFDDIIAPARASVDSEINITAPIRIEPMTDNWNNPGRFVFAILAPKAWNLKQNASLTLTSNNGDSWRITPDVTGEVLTLMPESETEPYTELPWSEAWIKYAAYATTQMVATPEQDMNDFEWVVWRSSSSFKGHDKTESGGDYSEPIRATVNIRLKTGEEPINCHLGYAYCYDSRGFRNLYKDTDSSYDSKNDAAGVQVGITYKEITTYAQVFATTPSVFRYGDIFAVQFTRQYSALKDADAVYLCGTAVYNDGQTAEVTTASEANRMEISTNGRRCEKYIYPRHFFSLPSDAVISELRFYFINADGSIVVKNEEGQEFPAEQAAE